MSPMQNLVALFKHISTKRRWQLVGVFVFMLVGAVAEMATLSAAVPFLALIADPVGVTTKYPWLLQFAAFMGDKTNYLLVFSVLFVLIIVIAGITRVLLLWCSYRYSMGLGGDIGKEVYRNTLYQPYSWHIAKNSSEIIASLDKVNAVVSGIISPLLQGMTAFVMGIGILTVLIIVDYQTALIAGVCFIALYGITLRVLKRRLLINGQVVSVSLGKRIKVVQEGVGGIRDILLDGTQEMFVQRFASCDYAMRRGQALTNLISLSPRYVVEMVGMVLIVLLAYWLTGGEATGFSGAIPVLGALAIGAQKLLPQMQAVYASWAGFNGNLHQLNAVIGFLDSPLKNDIAIQININDQSTHNTPVNPRDKPIIAARNVCFSYNPSAPQVLKSINLEIARGMQVGFIGKTGSGKSTLIDLFMGLLEPTRGSIEVDGTSLNRTNKASWQRRIAHVPQTIYLADASIEENIAFGVPSETVDKVRVRQSAERAQLSEFIEGLPLQYQTWVGERGVRLSGGQRQRIGLARAFYKQADVLILDEATSALDNATETAVMDSIVKNGDNLTVLMIAHRISTLQRCNLIIDLADGSISRKGTYGELFSQTYAV